MLLWLVPAALAQVTFSAPADYPVGANTQSVAVGDLDGDGDPDLAVANNLSGDVSVLLGDGSGAFAAAIDYPVGVGAASVAIADLNGDARLDLAVASIVSGVQVLLNTGSGVFVLAGTYPAGTTAVNVAVADLNGDAKPDLAVANEHSASVSVLLGNGDGTFAPAVNFGAGSFPRWVAIGDLNGDVRPDLAVANLHGDSVSVLLGNGDGTFAPAINHPTGIGPASVSIGDLDGDGDLDLVTANVSGAGASVLLGDGSGAFGPASAVAGAGSAINGALADVDGDGALDLVLSRFLSSPDVSVLLGDGSGGFGAPTDHFAGTQAVSVAVADLDGDGKPDLALARQAGGDNGNVSVLLQRAPAGCDLTLAPAGCWRFGEASLPAALDSSGHGNHGAYLGGPALGVPGALALDTAVSLDGQNDYVRVPDAAGLDVGDSLSLEGWIQRDNTDRTHQLYNKGNRGFHLVVMNRFNGNQVWLRKTNVATIARTTTGIPADGRYHHVVATKSGPNSAKLYIDGQLQPMQQVAGAQIIENTAFPLVFSAGSAAADAIAGDIDEYAVYDDVLTAGQVATHYGAATTVVTALRTGAAAPQP